MKYECRQGESFDVIAWRELGDVRHTSALMDANRQWLTKQVFEGGEEMELPSVSSGRVIGRAPWED